MSNSQAASYIFDTFSMQILIQIKYFMCKNIENDLNLAFFSMCSQFIAVLKKFSAPLLNLFVMSLTIFASTYRTGTMLFRIPIYTYILCKYSSN